MKQNKLYSWLTSLLVMVMLALVGQTAMAQDVTWDFDVDSNAYRNPGTKSGVTVHAAYWTGSQANLYSGDLTGTQYGWLKVSSETPITKIVFHEYPGWQGMQTLICSTGSFTSLATDVSTWEGSAQEIIFNSTSDVYVQSIDIYAPASVEPTTYTVNVNNAPVGATVVLDGQDLSAGGQITVEKNLNLNNLEITEPTGYYAEKEYDTTTHTFTVTFKEYLQYPVAVTGTTDANAGVVYDGVTYHAGESVLAKTAITAADVTAAEVSGLEGTVTLDAGTFTVTYKIPEYIEFVTTGIGGYNEDYSNTQSDVTIHGGTYDGYINLYNGWKWNLTVTSATKNIVKIVLQTKSGSINTHVTTGTFVEGDKTWTGSAKEVVFYADGDNYITNIKVYLEDLAPKEYTVSISGNPSEAKLKYDGNEYANGATFEATGLKETELSATDIEGYNYSIEINGTDVNVTYEVAPVNVTYTFTVNGVEIGSKVVAEFLGSAPTIASIFPSYVQATNMPSVVEQNAYTIETEYVGLPFEVGPDYVVFFRNGDINDYYWNDSNEGVGNEIRVPDDIANRAALDEYNRNAVWNIGGDWLNGFTFTNKVTGKKIVNPASGSKTFELGNGEAARFDPEWQFTAEGVGFYRFYIHGQHEYYLSHTGHGSHRVDKYNVANYGIDQTKRTDGTVKGGASIVQFEKIEPASYTLHITGAGVSTLYLPKNAVVPTGVTVYGVEKNAEAGTLHPVELDSNILPAGVGVVVEGTEGDYTFNYTEDEYDGSLDEPLHTLLGVTEDTPVEDALLPGCDVYVLSVVSGKVGFYKYASTATLKANRAFYRAEASAAINGFILDFNGTEGINAVMSATNLKAGYDIQGRRINKVQKGINILNGQKIIK